MSTCRPTKVLFGCAVVLAMAVANAAGETLDVTEYEPRMEQLQGLRTTVVGRFASMAGNRIKLVGSAIDFRLSETARPPRPGTKNVELTGAAAREGGRWVFVVAVAEAVPSDVEQFDERRRAIAERDFGQLYALSRWARTQARRYDDAELRSRAVSAFREAFAWEETALIDRGDGQGLLELADRGRELGLDQETVLRLTHLALWTERRRLEAAANWPALATLAETTSQRLPGAADRSLRLDQTTRERYLADPQAEFLAQPALRPALARAFWADLQAAVLRHAASSGTAPGKLAMQAAEQLPEFPELAREFHLADLRQQAATASALTRGKMLALGEEFERLGEAADHRQLATNWLAAQRAHLPQGDAEARLALADDYRHLLDDVETAAALYLEALELVPSLEEAASQLRSLGYEKLAGGWQRTAELRASLVEAERRRRVGGIAPGDLETAVIARLRRPDRVARTVTAAAVFEQWIYDGPPALYVYLRRLPGGREAAVVSITAPDAPASGD
ncbi:MAG: hypothetical protein K1X74_14975 [Pirellulales bacterium]|nr:hypothetical protein [Pirellulales bacterium]